MITGQNGIFMPIALHNNFMSPRFVIFSGSVMLFTSFAIFSLVKSYCSQTIRCLLVIRCIWPVWIFSPHFYQYCLPYFLLFTIFLSIYFCLIFVFHHIFLYFTIFFYHMLPYFVPYFYFYHIFAEILPWIFMVILSMSAVDGILTSQIGNINMLWTRNRPGRR